MRTRLPLVIVGGFSAMALVVLTSFTAQASPKPPTPLNELKVTNALIATYNYAGGTDPEQTVDVYYEPGLTNRPCMYVVHGGSWAAGSKANTADTSVRFENEGFVVFNIEYRKSTDYTNRPGVPWATQRGDVLAAIDWARSNAAQFGVDPSRCGTYGFSAGGHLAASVGLEGGGRVRAIVSASGVLQPHRVVDVALSDPRVGAGGDFPTDQNKVLAGWVHAVMRCPKITWTDCANRYAVFKPETSITADDPPMMIFQGTADPVVPKGTGRAFRYWLNKGGVPCQLTTASSTGTPCLIEGVNWNHTEFLAFDGGWRQAKMIAFLKAETAAPAAP
jgi:acetyl esterase/lipase